MAQHQTKKLLQNYLDVVNESMAANEDNAVYGKLLDAAEKWAGGKYFLVEIEEEDSDRVIDRHTIGVRNKRLFIEDKEVRSHELTWKIDENYLRKVTNNRKEYIDSPTKLDLDWLKSRVG